MRKVEQIIAGEYVIAMDGPLNVYQDGAVAVDGGRVVEAGPLEEISRKYASDSFSEGRGRAVLPGLVNTHTHAAMVMLRGMADDLSLRDWLEQHIWPSERRWLDGEFARTGVELACLEMLKAGITTFNDMYFYEDVAAGAAKALGMRAVLGAGILDFPTKVTTGAEDCLRKAEEFVSRFKSDELITPCVAPHAVFTCGPDTLTKARDIAERHGVGLHIHVSESRWEVEESRKKYGKTPGELLESLGLLGEKVLAAHCVWLTDEEIDTFARRAVGVSHCVESNLKLASGIAPVTKMLGAGIKVTFGTDGAASNNDLNVLSEMSTAAKLHKAVCDDPTALEARTVLLMATRWGAEALGLGDTCGSIEPGKAADIIVMDMEKPHLTPIYNIYSHLVYSARASDVDTVMVNGKIVVSGGRLLTAGEDAILERARAWGKRIREG
jgi:5-methylthioadenosine/S-adenosylhomocysteine deaminase